MSAELMNNYVNSDLIATELAGSNLGAEEKSVAVNAIVQARAQWVVDAIATEIASRIPTLEARESSLTGELAEVQKVLTTARQAVAETSLNTSESIELDERVKYRLELWGIVNTATKEEDVLALVEDEAPFDLILRDKVGRSLMRKVYDNKSAIDSIYGQGKRGLISRATGAFSRYMSIRDWEANVERGVIDSIIHTEEGTIIQIEDVPAFFKGLMGKTNFGKKSVIALLCAADFFADEAKEIMAAPGRDTPLTLH